MYKESDWRTGNNQGLKLQSHVCLELLVRTLINILHSLAPYADLNHQN